MPSDVRFTRAQKWDLLRISGAAVVSTVFFGVPMFIARPLPEIVRSEKRTVAPRPAGEVSVVVSETVAPVTTPGWEARPAGAVRQMPSRRHTASATVRSRRPVASASGTALVRLGRLLAGSGRYEVRPFPTLE